MIELQAISSLVSDLLELPVRAHKTGNQSEVGIRVEGLDRPNHFVVLARAQLESLYADLAFDTLAKPLIMLMDKSTPATWDQFDAQLEALHATGLRVSVIINGSEYKSHTYPTVQSISFSAKQLNWNGSTSLGLASIASSLLALALTLIPISERPAEHSKTEPDVIDKELFRLEGRRYQGTYTKYERSRTNRAIAILVHGTTCSACNFNFESTYGKIGAGFVEIHHKVPVHLMGEERVVDPIEDLVPLCSNCHRMVHTVDPPIPVEKLKEIVIAEMPPKTIGIS